MGSFAAAPDVRNSPMTATYEPTHSRHTVPRMKNDA